MQRGFNTHGFYRTTHGQIEIDQSEIEAILRLRDDQPQEGGLIVIQGLIARVRQQLGCGEGKERVIFSWDLDLIIAFDRGHCLSLEDGTAPPCWIEGYRPPPRAFGISVLIRKPEKLAAIA